MKIMGSGGIRWLAGAAAAEKKCFSIFFFNKSDI
jgi:hypothetical protein